MFIHHNFYQARRTFLPLHFPSLPLARFDSLDQLIRRSHEILHRIFKPFCATCSDPRFCYAPALLSSIDENRDIVVFELAAHIAAVAVWFTAQCGSGDGDEYIGRRYRRAQCAEESR